MAAVAKLPKEIVIDILVRLPVKSLIRFKCVSKSWRSSINDPYFIRKHVNHVYKGGHDNIIFPLYTTTTTIFKSMEIDKEEGEEVCNSNSKTPKVLSVKDVDFPAELDPSGAVIKGCCDGILCVAISDSVVLWNPSIKQYRRLPPSPLEICRLICRFAVLGIGYDASVDDHKILRAPTKLTMTNFAHSAVEVFTLKSNSWKTIQDNFPYEIDYTPSSFTNGGIHWVGRHFGTSKSMIIRFDVVAENFEDLPLPQGIESSCCGPCATSLQLFRGHLSVVHSHARFGGGMALDVWVMKEYGVRECWYKHFTVPESQGVGELFEQIWPFYVTRTGTIIFKGSSEFVQYNPRDGSFLTFPSDINLIQRAGKIPYAESLVSPIGNLDIGLKLEELSFGVLSTLKL